MDIQWKLGIALSSDTCRSLNSPYVTMLLKFVETSGQICQRSFEMTIPQFQVCICCCEPCVFVLLLLSLLDSFVFLAELSQAIQRDCSCYGDGVIDEEHWRTHNSYLLAVLNG